MDGRREEQQQEEEEERGNAADAGFKEIQNILDNSALNAADKSWRKYARLVLPHVGLVIFVCLYAVLGAWVFYRIESPNEDRLKLIGILRVQQLRRQLVNDLLAASTDQGKPSWVEETGTNMRQFGEDLFRAYKDQYVRYEDVRLIAAHQQQQQPTISTQTQDPRFRRHFGGKSRSEGKMWTPGSALFFAATTMATIGYGNIVPVTSHGRIACIIFALFGAPLAIITIGDLGKFLSECTIWMYRRIKDKYLLCRYQLNHYLIVRKKRRRRRIKEQLIANEVATAAVSDNEEEEEEEGMDRNGNNKWANNKRAGKRKQTKEHGKEEEEERTQKAMEEEAEAAQRERNKRLKSTEKRLEDWEEEENEVPVLVVFAILLLYIALGGVLFALLESWTYMDAFYYCFVSLTTIGFGDLVPDRHEYIALMLLYLGVGLAVTTMCIDLVGIQYIQKIHYFGRKFKGTDILQILRRKRMMERRFAMGQGQEFIEFVIRQEREALHQQRTFPLPVLHMASQLYARDEQEEEKISLQSEEECAWPMVDVIVQDVFPSNEYALANALPTPGLLESTPLAPPRTKQQQQPPIPSPTISPSSESERSIMYNQQYLSGRTDSWTESGPTPSMKSSPLSTDPSVHQREQFYNNFRSPEASLNSFAFTFPPPSPDIWKIAEVARVRRLASCPELLPYPPSLESLLMPPPVILCRTAELPEYPLILSLPPSPPPPEPHPPERQQQLVSLPPVQQAHEALVEDPRPSNIDATLPPIARTVAMYEQIDEQAKAASTQANVAQRLLPSFTSSELLALSSAELRHLSPQQYVLEQQHLLLPDPVQASSVDERELTPTHVATALDDDDADAFARHMHLAAVEQQPWLVNSVRRLIAEIPQMPSLERLSLDEQMLLEEEEEEEEPMFEIDLGAFELVDTGITAEELLANEDPVIYHKDLPVHSVHHDTVQTEAAIQNLMNAPQSMLSSHIPPTMVADNYCFAVDADQIRMGDILGDEHWWRHTSRPTKYFYTEDLRRFYRVNLLTVKGKIVSARLANTTPAMGASSAAEMMAPELQLQQQPAFGGGGQASSFSFSSLPATARRSVTFCTGGSIGRPSFVMPSSDVAAPTPTAADLFPSALAYQPLPAAAAPPPSHALPPSLHPPQLSPFLNSSTSAGGTSLSLFPSSPHPIIGRHSIAPFVQQQSGTFAAVSSQQWRPAAQPELVQRGESVDLSKVYRVVRFYSFWRTCTAFHRIVTMIERVGDTPLPRSQSHVRLYATASNAGQGTSQGKLTRPNTPAGQSDSSSSAAKSTRSSRAPPEFQKRLFVQYLWRNIKPGDKARVQREFDPRRQRLLRYVADPSARKRMTTAKMQFRSGSAGPSMERSLHHHQQQRLMGTTTPGSASPAARQTPTFTFSQSARSSIRFRLPSDRIIDNAGMPISDGGARPSPRPHSSPVSPMRRVKTAGEIGRMMGASNTTNGGDGGGTAGAPPIVEETFSPRLEAGREELALAPKGGGQ